uniref:Protein kinase domain-containing protein n=1 Tax=Meloidogyne hapla TaxID=6305 RepID=A0A1I8AX64_MELHA
MAKHILEGLNKIHKSNILHRDMKSANVLITGGGFLKLADFGLARLMIKQQDYRYTNRVVTLWYRPPELLLGSSSYGPSIDIWGAGCIISELWTRSPILQGNTEQEQLIRIAKLCGSINSQTWEGCEDLPLYSKLKAGGCDMQSALNNALPQNYPRRVREKLLIFLEHNEQAISLIDQMLSLSPERRPTAEEALDHNFFWEAPLSAENIKGLVDTLKGKNFFEYTAGCGAHANRKRPIAPAAPTHNSSGSSQGSQPMHQQTRKPLNAFQQQQKSQQSNFVQHNQQFSNTGGTQSRIKGNNAVVGQPPLVRMQSSQQRPHQPLSRAISSFPQQQSSQSFSQQAQQASTSNFVQQSGFGNQPKRKRLVPPEPNEAVRESLHHSSNTSYQHHQKSQQFFQNNQQPASSDFSSTGRNPNRSHNQHSYNAQAPPQSLQNANKPASLFSQPQQSSQQQFFVQQAPRKLITEMLRVGGTPLLVLSKSAEREQGSKVQSQNINAAKVLN